MTRSTGRLGLSRICLGTMRIDRAADAAALLRQAREMGVSSFHCSSEYESFPLFREAWGRARLGDSKIVAKVAVPHFGEESFSAAAFRAKIDFYLAALGLERLDVVQWLLRYDLKQEEARLAILAECAQEMGDAVAALKREGKIGHLVSFPYTTSFAAAVLRHDWCEGLALYVNPLEREMDGQADRCAELGRAVVAIRPYAAGRLFSETKLTADQALAHVFGIDAVETAVVSASTPAHLEALRPWLDGDGA